MIRKSDLFLLAFLRLAPVAYCGLAHPSPTGPGTLDLEFDPPAGVSGGIETMQELPDGKILVGGGFSRIQGISRSRLARLNADGSVDTSFVPPASGFVFVHSAMLSTNGSVVVMGTGPIAANNLQRSKIVRLRTDGSVDAGFKPLLSSANNLVAAIHVVPNGFVYVALSYEGPPDDRLFRLSSDGVWDTSYQVSMDGLVSRMIGLADGKVLLIGSFNAIAGRERHRLARLNADGTLDETFVPETIYHEIEISPERIAVQPDGKILVVDTYSEGFGWPDKPRARLSRFNSDGSLDLSLFSEWDDRVQITAMKVQSNGAIVLATVPLDSSDPPPSSLIRLFPDGSLDYGFNRATRANDAITALASLAGNQLLIGGSFSRVAGSSRNGLARIRAGESTPVTPVIVRHPAGDHLPEGADLILDPLISAVPRASYQWQKDGVSLPDQTNRLLIIRNLQTGNAGDYRILAESRSGSAISSVASILIDPIAPGSVDASFYNGFGPNGAVNQVVELSDGKLLIAGNFTAVDHKLRPRIARLNADGTLDEQFNPSVGPDNQIACLAVLDDGQILIGGPFERIGNTDCRFLALLNPDGTLNPANKIAADSPINRIVIAKDGRILTCGEGFVRRWNRDGTADSTFQTFNFAGIALALDFQPDGKIVVVVGGQNIARLNPNGSVDKSFKAGSGANGGIADLDIQPDGKILIAGTFTTFNGVRRGHIARLNIDGSLDTSFAIQTGATGGRVFLTGHFGMVDLTAITSLLLQADGHIVITGEFNAFDNVPAGNIVRLHEDGTFDHNFITGKGFPTPDPSTTSRRFARVMRLQRAANDGIFVMGDFPGIDRVARPGLVKLVGREIAPYAPVIKSKSDTFDARTGTDLLLGVQALGFPRVSFQWLHDGQIIAGATGPSLVLRNLRRQVAGEYSCLVSNGLGSVQFMAARISIIPPRIQAGAVDSAFYPNWDQTFQINSVTLETDGRILLAGAIPGSFGTQPVVLRLKPDGSTETDFDFKGAKIQAGDISRALPLPDGNVLINGSLDLIQDDGNVTNVNWIRIKPDGTLDPAYNPPINTGYSSFLIKLSNGKILAGGDSTTGPRVYRLNPDGTLDKSFAGDVTFDGRQLQAVEDGQGRLLIGGDFSMSNGGKRNRIVRLNPDGAVDVSFDPGAGLDGGVTGIGLQPDGSIIISGWFGEVDGARKLHLARLHRDGSLDATFPKSNLGPEDVLGMVVVPDGRILLAFQLPPNPNQSTFRVVRLDADGRVDPTLNLGSGFRFVNQGLRSGFSATLLSLTLTGKILIAGVFDEVDGLPRNGIARLYSEAGPRLILQPDPSIQNPPSSADRRWRLLWDEGSLEEAASVSGPWRSAEAATNSFPLLPQDVRRFYRLRVDL